MDAQPVIDLFKYIYSIMGSGNKLHVITGTRLAMVNHVIKNEEELIQLYRKTNLPEHLAETDSRRNRALMEESTILGRTLSVSG